MKLPASKYKSQLEADFALHLTCKKVEFHYECIKLKIGDGVFYLPDFIAMSRAGEVYAIEIKGPHSRRSGEIKFLAAKERYPMFQWMWVTRREDGSWRYTRKPLTAKQKRAK